MVEMGFPRLSALVCRVLKLLRSKRGDRWLGEMRITIRDSVPNCNLLGLICAISKWINAKIYSMAFALADDIIWHLAVRW